MAVQPILSTDTLETGFRAKYNTSINEIITGYTLLQDNNGAYTKVLRLLKYGGGFINVDLSDIFYTKAEIGQLVQGISSSPYKGSWNSSVAYTSQQVVDYNNTLWRSSISNNLDEPGTTATWVNILSTSLPQIVLTAADLGTSYGNALNVVGTKLILTYTPEIIAILGQKKPHGYPDLLNTDTGDYSELTPTYSQRDGSGNITAVYWDGYSGQQFYLDLIAP